MKTTFSTKRSSSTTFSVGVGERVGDDLVKVLVGTNTGSGVAKCHAVVTVKVQIPAIEAAGVIKTHVDPTAALRKAAISRINDEMKGLLPSIDASSGKPQYR